MWAKITFTHPSVRRFKTAVSLTGTVLTQELTGTQQQTITGMGASPKEYTDLVRAAEASEFVEGLQASASEQIHSGIDVLNVQITGTRKLPIGQTDDAEYAYASNCGA